MPYLLDNNNNNDNDEGRRMRKKLKRCNGGGGRGGGGIAAESEMTYLLDNNNEGKLKKRLKRCDGGGIAAGAESERSERRRSWNDMNHDILVNIMLRLSWREWALIVCYICQSWLSALLDALFPAGNPVLDLRRLEFIKPDCPRKRFRHYIKLVLDRRPYPVWTKLILANIPLRDDFYLFLAQRLPLLEVLVVPMKLKIYMQSLTTLIPYWKNLRVVHIRPSMVIGMSIHCKYICLLSLNGLIGNDLASRIATEFPLLKHLVLRACLLSMNALSLILDVHKNLELLDTRHSYRLSDEEFRLKAENFLPEIRPTKWNEEEICQKATAIKIHLQCAREHCPKCSHRYQL